MHVAGGSIPHPGLCTFRLTGTIPCPLPVTELEELEELEEPYVVDLTDE